ncbi:MAG TPA: hypothetical protein ENL09_05785 [Bacteroidetes bacterium]|nr:hypothetical protein [Bacteroidota bacterium]
MNKTTAFLTFAKWHQRPGTGSSKIRAEWLINHWSEAEVFVQGKEYKVIIFQKTYWLEYVKKFKGIKILDLADPDYLDTVPIKEIIDNCDAVTTSTEALAEAIRQFTDKPVLCIPDRVDLDVYNVQKEHKGRAKKVCWFGYSHNAKLLDKVILTLKKYNLKLKVISNFRPPYQKANENVKFEEETFNENVLDCDFMVLPRDDRPRGKYKSNNKTIISQALGMPVATNPQEVKRFLDPEERKKEAELRLKEVREKWDVRLSVKSYQDLINRRDKNKSNNRV